MKQYSVAFYTEAGTKRGMGHLMRSHTICEKFKEENFETSFFLDSDINFDYKFNNINYFSWDKLEIDFNYDVVFIDSYEANIDIYDAISNIAKIAVYIDDYGRLKYPKGIIINFAPDSKELFFKKPQEKYNYLLGLEYIPIRKEFIISNIQKKEQIFIMFGGSDVGKLSESILKSIDNISIPKVIVVNNENTFKELNKYNNTKVLYKPKDSELISAMASSSIAISTASMTLYELSFFNIPTIIIALNHNQKVGAIQSIKHNLAEKLLEIKKENWENKLQDYIEEIRIKDNFITKRAIDGKGTQRILNSVKAVLKLSKEY